MARDDFSQPGSYRLLPPSLRGRLIVACIKSSGLPLKYFSEIRLFQYLLQFTAKGLGKVADQKQKCEYSLRGGGRFRFYMRDPYWTKLLSKNFEYEPEIRRLLEIVSENKFCFMDCGANFGYWSVLATTKWKTCTEAIAVEAAPPTYDLLLENQKINDDSFQTKNCALYDKDNATVQIRFHPNRHAGASIYSSNSDWSSYDVDTISLDTLANSFTDQTSPMVVKLDVEGLELKVISGIRDLYRRPFIIIYEDHGKDLTSATTRALIEHENLRVYFMSDSGGLIRIETVDQVNALKKNRRRGYNFALTEAGSAMDLLLKDRVQ